MSKVHYVDETGNQACKARPWWSGIVSEPGIYQLSDGGELHADPLKTSSDWEKVTCKNCQKHNNAKV